MDWLLITSSLQHINKQWILWMKLQILALLNTLAILSKMQKPTRDGKLRDIIPSGILDYQNLLS